MDTAHISLLWPKDEREYASKIKRLNSDTVNNLNIEGLCNYLTKDKDQHNKIREILINMCFDEEVISYRQEIFKDIISSENLRTALQNISNMLKQLQFMYRDSSKPEEPNLWKSFSRFKELEVYVNCINEIKQALLGFDLKAAGLINLRDLVVKISEDVNFKALTGTVKSLALEINEIQSITLGINLDSSLNPVEATIVSINKTKFKDNSWIRGILQNKGVNPDDAGYMSKIHGISQDRRHPVMYTLYRDIENLLKPVVKDLSSNLRKYNKINVNFLLKLITEIDFYLNFSKLYKYLYENKMPVCMPEIIKIEERKCIIDEAYNINLALHLLNSNRNPGTDIVLNNISFGENGRILILTGPNRGGKTVYTEAIGLIQVLFQAGVFVPGLNAALSPVDFIFTHFPVDENQTVELGRLGEETKRLSEILKNVTKFSLVLLNESLASTSFTEGLYIAQDIVKSLKYLETRALFNTHMHELANFCDTINNEIEGDSIVVSLVTGLVEGKRSYKINPGPPLGKSYARDIAVKYGVSFEQIIAANDKKSYGTI